MPPQPSKRRRVESEDVNLPTAPSPSPSTDDSSEDFDVQQDASTAPSIPKPKKVKSSVPAVTDKDLKNLSVMGQYKSNVFKLELDEMLAEVRMNPQKKLAGAEKLLHQLRNLIDGLPEKEGISVADVRKEMKNKGVHVPFPDPAPAEDVQYKFAFGKPAYMNIVGSYATKTMVKHMENITIDLVLTMPETIFQPKDYLNYRYFHKRAYYLAVIAAGLQADIQLKKLELTYEYFQEDPLLPVIVVAVKQGGDPHKCSIRIIPSAPPRFFEARKLLPSKCCIRNSDSERQLATPFYNSSVAVDTTYIPYLKLLHSSSTQCAAFSNASIVGRIWLRQRGFGGSTSKGGFGPFEWAILMAFLLKTGGAKGQPYLMAGYSEYQMFKAMLQFIATRNLSMKPLVVNGNPDEVVEVTGPGVVDAEYGGNILFKMTPWSYNALRHEAKCTLECLSQNTVANQFDSVFIYRVDASYLRFDASASIPMPTAKQLSAYVKPNGTPGGLAYLGRVYDALKTGLGDRVKLIHVSGYQSPRFGLSGSPTQETGSITLGFLFNETNIARKVDRGPAPTEQKAAAAFRKFWGEVAELRRYPDGTITESTSWSSKGDPIYQQIIRYVITRHLSSEIANNIIFSDKSVTKMIPQLDTAGGLQTMVSTHFDSLSKDLENMSGLPLSLRHIAGSGSAFSGTSVFLPGDPTVRQNSPIDVIVQFESSGRWPDDLPAIQRIKTSFLARIAELLEEAKAGEVNCNLGYENRTNREDDGFMNTTFMDVTYAPGCTFRLRVLHDKEPILLDQLTTNPHTTPRIKERARSALLAHRRTFDLRTRHSQLIRKIGHRFPTFLGTVRLTKKWFHAQLLSSNQVPEELIELFVAKVYLHPFPWAAPSSTTTAFYRVLHMLMEWDWRIEPLVVDLNNGDVSSAMKTEDISKARDAFRSRRETDPTMQQGSMFAVTNYDLTESVWTDEKPSKVVAGRITGLAKSAMGLVAARKGDIEPSELFAPSITEYDFVIHTNKKYRLAANRTGAAQFKNLAIDVGDGVAHDPVRDFVEEISELLDGIAVIFWDSISEGIIAGIWSPNTATRKWKPTIMHSTVPVKAGEEVNAVFNRASTLNEIAVIGGDLIARVDAKT